MTPMLTVAGWLGGPTGPVENTCRFPSPSGRIITRRAGSSETEKPCARSLITLFARFRSHWLWRARPAAESSMPNCNSPRRRSVSSCSGMSREAAQSGSSARTCFPYNVTTCCSTSIFSPTRNGAPRRFIDWRSRMASSSPASNSASCRCLKNSDQTSLRIALRSAARCAVQAPMAESFSTVLSKAASARLSAVSATLPKLGMKRLLPDAVAQSSLSDSNAS
mmetsp:Transcript_116012/g.323124  ORF Transcript_116012/g.323124 Transcript_116012/m.323124 type:complete len:222 (+) Transcript_116012:229-894(+)